MAEHALQQLIPQAGQQLHHSRDPDITIRQSNEMRWMHFADSAVQACMLLREPHKLLLPYTQAMLSGLVFIEQPERLLNLGLGGGSFNRFFAQALPLLEVESVDSSAEVIELSQRFFVMPENSTVHCSHAEVFVAKTTEQYDVIFCDLFSADGHPDCMFDAAFYADCCRSLGTAGVLAVNLLVTDEAQMINLLQQVRRHFPTVVLLAVPEHANTILFALKQTVIDQAFVIKRAQQLSAAFDMELAAYLERFVMLTATADGG